MEEKIQKPKGGHCASFTQEGYRTLTVQGFPLDCCAPYLGPSLLHSLSQPRDLGKFWSTNHQSQAETKCRWGWLGAGGGKKGELSFNEYRISVLRLKRVLVMGGDDVINI